MKFREYLNENNCNDIITTIKKNTHYDKKMIMYDGEIYFSMKQAKGAINLVKRLNKQCGIEVAGGEIGYYDMDVSAILGDAKAYIKVKLDYDVDVKELSQSEYEKNIKAQGK
jgi:uncharacterized protein YegP (UPF0339 family)